MIKTAALLLRSFLFLGLIAAVQAVQPLSRDSVWGETLTAREGPSVVGVDTSTLKGKVMTGYQGWFNCESDGAERGWVHWTKRRGPIEPGNAKFDVWPDVSELALDERFVTGFKHADGRTAEVFSSFRAPTVRRHFEWMREYGIDGALVQRFAADLRDPRVLRHANTVLGHCRDGAHRNGRAYAVMYDLSGLGANRMSEVIEDWKRLRERLQPAGDKAYLQHRGKPLVAVWGLGFSDGRAYTLAECRQLVEFLKADGCTVMLGVPTFWRELKNDAAPDPALHEVLRLADIVSPWTVARFRDEAGVKRHAEKVLSPDLAWCREHGLDYLPVVFPGFSWHNMKGAELNAIPRQQGRFLWSQFVAAQRAGAEMAYVAMFDEVDEGTAIFKCIDTVPAQGGSAFIPMEGSPSDHYLRLTGEAAKMLRGERPLTDSLP
ncbi:MAG TPA: glycoside hydrolase family 71/99-like protein [Chthoniobacteraceae bacterium]|nr:glycoside hydrolase family 71/99-like protein [Chthoniobacteraceae bacterium]